MELTNQTPLACLTVEQFKDLCVNYLSSAQYVPPTTYDLIDIKEMYQRFMDGYTGGDSCYSQRKFTESIQKYCLIYGKIFKPSRKSHEPHFTVTRI